MPLTDVKVKFVFDSFFGTVKKGRTRGSDENKFPSDADFQKKKKIWVLVFWLEIRTLGANLNLLGHPMTGLIGVGEAGCGI